MTVKNANQEVKTVSDLVTQLAKPGMTNKKIANAINKSSDDIYVRLFSSARNDTERMIVLLKIAEEY